MVLWNTTEGLLYARRRFLQVVPLSCNVFHGNLLLRLNAHTLHFSHHSPISLLNNKSFLHLKGVKRLRSCAILFYFSGNDGWSVVDPKLLLGMHQGTLEAVADSSNASSQQSGLRGVTWALQLTHQDRNLDAQQLTWAQTWEHPSWTTVGLVGVRGVSATAIADIIVPLPHSPLFSFICCFYLQPNFSHPFPTQPHRLSCVYIWLLDSIQSYRFSINLL